MEFSKAFKNFQNKKFTAACSQWLLELQQNVFQWQLHREINQAREEIYQIEIDHGQREQFINKLNAIDTWFGIEQYWDIAMSGLSDSDMSPFSILLHNEHIYISDEWNHKIIVLGMDGKVVREIGSKGLAPGYFWYPSGIAVVSLFENSDNQVLVCCDCWNHRLQFFSLDGQFIRTMGQFGSNQEDFKGPYDIAVYDEQFILVADRANHRIKKISLVDETIDVIGQSWDTSNSLDDVILKIDHDDLLDSIPAHFEYPGGILIDDNQRVIVSDRFYTYLEINNHRMHSFFGNVGTIMPRNLTGKGSRLMVKDEVTDDVYCMTEKGFPVCRFSGDNRLYPVRDTNGLIEIDNNHLLFYRFKKSIREEIPPWIIIANRKKEPDIIKNTFIAYGENHLPLSGKELLEIFDSNLKDRVDDNFLIPLLHLWQKSSLAPKKFSSFILNFINEMEHDLRPLYTTILKKQTKIDRLVLIELKNQKENGALDEDLTDLYGKIRLSRENVNNDVLAFFLKIHRLFGIFAKTIKMVFITIDEDKALLFADFIIRTIDKWDTVVNYTYDNLPEDFIKYEYKDRLVGSYMNTVELLCQENKFTYALAALEALLSIDPTNKTVHSFLKNILDS